MGSQFTVSARQNDRPLIVLALLLLCQSGPAVCRTTEEGNQPAYPPQQQLTGVSTTKPSMRLEGKAEFQQYTNIAAWQASQNYRQGVAALSAKDFNMAADFFKQAGDGFAVSPGAGKFLAEARFAEGQSRRLMKQNAQAAKLFAEAVDLFRKYDLFSPYLKAAVDYRNALNKAAPLKGNVAKFDANLKSLPAQMNMVDKHVVLKGKITKLEDGTKIAALKDDDFFTGGSRRLLPEAAEVDVSDATSITPFSKPLPR